MLNKINEGFNKAEKIFKKKFDVYLYLNKQLNSTAGLAILQKNNKKKEYVIELNLRMLEKYGEKFINDVIPHEICHIVDLKLNGISSHGGKFQKIGKALGYSVKSRHDFEKISKRNCKVIVMKCKCREHEMQARFGNKVLRGEIEPVCNYCKKKLKFVRTYEVQI